MLVSFHDIIYIDDSSKSLKENDLSFKLDWHSHVRKSIEEVVDPSTNNCGMLKLQILRVKS